MTRRLVSTGSPFERQAGYSRAVVDGDWCFVAGTTGYDYATMAMPDDVATQTANAMDTIERALIEGGFALADVVRVNYIVTDASFADAVFSIVGPRLKDIRPAAMIIVAGLLKPEMKVEIEVTAKRRG
jgi:enamine deaminase RidA (YjgF/YER057c/UK114 family)